MTISCPKCKRNIKDAAPGLYKCKNCSAVISLTKNQDVFYNKQKIYVQKTAERYEKVRKYSLLANLLLTIVLLTCLAVINITTSNLPSYIWRVCFFLQMALFFPGMLIMNNKIVKKQWFCPNCNNSLPYHNSRPQLPDHCPHCAVRLQ